MFQASIALPENKVFMLSNIHGNLYSFIPESSKATGNTHLRSSQPHLMSFFLACQDNTVTRFTVELPEQILTITDILSKNSQPLLA